MESVGIILSECGPEEGIAKMDLISTVPHKLQEPLNIVRAFTNKRKHFRVIITEHEK